MSFSLRGRGGLAYDCGVRASAGVVEYMLGGSLALRLEPSCFALAPPCRSVVVHGGACPAQGFRRQCHSAMLVLCICVARCRVCRHAHPCVRLWLKFHSPSLRVGVGMRRRYVGQPPITRSSGLGAGVDRLGRVDVLSASLRGWARWCWACWSGQQSGWQGRMAPCAGWSGTGPRCFGDSACGAGRFLANPSECAQAWRDGSYACLLAFVV